MNPLRAVLFTLSLVAAVNAYAYAGQHADMRNLAAQTVQAWNQALNNQDAARFSGLFTFDAVLLTPGGEAATGLWEIYSFADTLAAGGGIPGQAIGHRIEITHIGVSDGRAFVTGKWNAAKKINGRSQGDLVAILEKQFDGSWRTRFVKWN